MKILITNWVLDIFRGSENWCYAVACELKRRGHDVEIYTPMPGKFINEFEKVGCKLVESGEYDLILDNHCIAKDTNKFKGFIIHTCHGIGDWEKSMPGVVNVGVSKKAAAQWNLDVVIPNGIDTQRMIPKTQPREKIKKILSLCMTDTANDVLRSICQDANVEFESLYGKFVFDVENKINDADLVVGVGRSLLDAMSCGRPVVSFDDRFYYETRMMGYGYITPDKFSKYVIDSFTGNDIKKTWTKEELTKEIFEKYNPVDGKVNRKFIVENYNIAKTVDMYLELYERTKPL